MHAKLEKALAEAFAGLVGVKSSARLEALKAEMAEVLEERLEERRKTGVIEEAALKKVLGDFEKIRSRARSGAGGDKSRELAQIARALGLSPLGRRLAMIRTASAIMAAFAALTALFAWNAGAPAGGAIAAFTPFALAAACGFAYVRFKSR